MWSVVQIDRSSLITALTHCKLCFTSYIFFPPLGVNHVIPFNALANLHLSCACVHSGTDGLEEQFLTQIKDDRGHVSHGGACAFLFSVHVHNNHRCEACGFSDKTGLRAAASSLFFVVWKSLSRSLWPVASSDHRHHVGLEAPSGPFFCVCVWGRNPIGPSQLTLTYPGPLDG